MKLLAPTCVPFDNLQQSLPCGGCSGVGPTVGRFTRPSGVRSRRAANCAAAVDWDRWDDMTATPPSDPPRWASSAFAAAAFLSAALLFLLEPWAGKTLLPWYGGAPAVWNTCVFFFQLVLLLGYVYAHLLVRSAALRAQLLVHGCVLLAALGTLPLHFHVQGLTGPAAHPVASVLFDLLRSVGPVFFVLSATAPLLQAWFAAARCPGDVFRLYAASNAGSLVSLLAYPTLVEPAWPLSAQAAVLTWGFGGLVIALAGCGAIAWRAGAYTPGAVLPPTAIEAAPVDWRTRGLWLVLAMSPSSLMLGATTHLSTEIAPMPAIWILPLALYLLTFILAFSTPRPTLERCAAVGFVLLALLAAAAAPHANHTGQFRGVLVHGGLVFCGAFALHARLAASRPAAGRLTEFYVWISLGGLAGSAFNSLLAPWLFDWMAEYPLALILTLALLPWPRPETEHLLRIAQLARGSAMVLVLLGFSWNDFLSEEAQLCQLHERTFFGELRVLRGSRGVVRQLVHGSTVHGVQITSRDPRERRPPLTYYFVTGPIGEVIQTCRGTLVTQSVGVVGLGVGSLAAYAEDQDRYTFYEIDPAVARIAEATDCFTYLADARSRGAVVDVLLGDARLKLREADPNRFGLLVLDAFTSDAVPVHLLTREAIEEYLTKLADGGLLAVHISNRYVDFEPVLANAAESLGCAAYIRVDADVTPEELQLGKKGSTWVVIAPRPESLAPVLKGGRWRPCQTNPRLGVWTDDRSHLLSLLRWRAA